MKKIVFVILVFTVAFVKGYTAWSDYPTNPVVSGKAYYPTVLYDVNSFGDSEGIYTVPPYYKMWYSDGNGIAFAYSEDGINWIKYGNLSTLPSYAHHSKVIYDKNGFEGTSVKYKIWYWDTRYLYTINAIRYAESQDGINWMNDQAITQDAAKPLVTGVNPDWNRGSYGPIYVIYNSQATNSGSNPFDYSYVMYYDGTTGAFEEIGLAYSEDGKHWFRYGDKPVLERGGGVWGNSDTWDSSYVGFGTVLKIGGLWHMWYSGGRTAMHQGIGYATSLDGITWIKYSENPLKSLGGFGDFQAFGAPESFNEVRNYTPSVLYDANRFSGHGDSVCLKMWRTGEDSDGNKTIGYAVSSLCPQRFGDFTNPLEYLRPLAQTRISNNEEIKNEVSNLLLLAKEKGLDTSGCEIFIEKAKNLLQISYKFFLGKNYEASNVTSLKALDFLKKAKNCLEDLLEEGLKFSF